MITDVAGIHSAFGSALELPGSHVTVLRAFLTATASAVHADYIAVWAAEEDNPHGRLRPLALWSAGNRTPRLVDRAIKVPVPADEYAAACSPELLVVFSADTDEADVADTRPLLDTIVGCVATVLRSAQLTSALDAARGRAQSLKSQLATARDHLATAQELEQRAVVTEILGISSPRLSAIRVGVEVVESSLAGADREAAQRAVSSMSGAVENLAEQFRGVVAGAHSTVLRQHGLRTAVTELASGMPRRVQVSADELFAASPPTAEVAVVAYHLIATVFREFAQNGAGPITLSLSCPADALVCELRGELATQDRVRALVSVTAGHATALGGSVTVGFDERLGLVRLSLPRSLRPPTPSTTAPVVAPGVSSDADVEHARVAAADHLLIEQTADLLRDAATHSPNSAAELDIIFRRLQEPMRIAIIGPDRRVISGALQPLLRRWLPREISGLDITWLVRRPGGGTGIPARGDPGEGETLNWTDAITVGLDAPALDNAHIAVGVVPGPGGRLLNVRCGADAVITFVDKPGGRPVRQAIELHAAYAPSVALVTALAGRRAADRTRLFDKGRVVELAQLIEQRAKPWSAVLRVRSALTSAAECLSNDASGTETLAAVEHLRTSTGDLNNVQTLAGVWSGGVVVAERFRLDAIRLLGGSGRTPSERLGLRSGASLVDRRQKAALELRRWRATTINSESVTNAVVDVCETLAGLHEPHHESWPVRSG